MNAIKIIAVAFLAAVFVVGCTPYKKDGISGGYSETQLAENVFEVSFRGNGYTSSQRASDFSLLRSAELTLEKGFRYFVVDGAQNTSRTYISRSPSQSYTIDTGYGTQTTTYGGDVQVVSKPRAKKVIVCYREKPDWPGAIYEAELIVQSLKEKYKIE